MAMTTGTALALAAMAASAGLQYSNTRQTAKRTDNEAAAGIRKQSGIQQRADARVNEEVDRLANSTAEDERATRTNEFMTALRNARGNSERGLEGMGLGEAFNVAAAGAKQDLRGQSARTAGQLATIDAAGLQRQGEGVAYGNLATDIGLLGRESGGQQFLTDLRTRAASRRNPGMDAAAGFLSGVASGIPTGAGAAASGAASGLASGATGIGAGLYGSLGGGLSNDQLIAAMRGNGGGG